MRFRATIQLDGKTSTGVQVPGEVVEALGGGKRPPVRVTIKGHTYRSTVGSMGGVYKIPISAENRKIAGVSAGDEVDIDVELDTEKRDVVPPPDLAKALEGDPAAKQFFAGLSASKKGAYVTWIEQAKKEETRQRRVAEAVEKLRAGQTR
ncbi:MAG TPA: YdeI/OmpD-associated family protein [Streptosporangiaceae bacterium]